MSENDAVSYFVCRTCLHRLCRKEGLTEACWYSFCSASVCRSSLRFRTTFEAWRDSKTRQDSQAWSASSQRGVQSEAVEVLLRLQVEEGRHGRFVHLLLERRFSIRCVEVGGPPVLPTQCRGVEREGRRRGGSIEGRNRRSGWEEGSRVEKPFGRESGRWSTAKRSGSVAMRTMWRWG